MGIEAYMINSALLGVISQRLVKILCPKCKEKHIINKEELSFIRKYYKDEVNTIYRAVGCKYCNNGYFGRRGIHEIMVVDENIRQVIKKDLKLDEIRRVAKENGMVSLLENGIELVLDGTTSLDEIIRVAYTIDK